MKSRKVGRVAGTGFRIQLRPMLLAGFVVMVLAVGAAAWFGVFGMRNLNAKLARAQADLFERTRLMDEARVALANMDRALLNHLLATDKAEKEAYEADMLGCEAVLFDRLSTLAAHPLTSLGRQLVDRIYAAAQRMRPVRDRMLELSVAGRDDEVHDMSQSEWRLLTRDMDAAMAAFAAFQGERFDAERKNADTHYRRAAVRAAIVVVGVLGFMLLLYGTAAGVVSRSLRDFARGAREYARGNFGHRVRSEAGREFAELAEALNTMATERQQSESRLRTSEEKYRTLVENLPQRIFLKDPNSVYVSANGEFSRDLRMTPDEIRGKTDYDFFPPELADKYRADDRRVVESREPVEVEEQYIRDGRMTWVHTVKTPVRDAQGNAAGILGIFWDVTERRQAEMDRKRLTEELQHKNEELEQIVYAASHDLRTPLVSVEGFAGELAASLDELLSLLRGEDLPESVRKKVVRIIEQDVPESLGYIKAGTAKMSVLLAGLLRLSRLGRVPVKLEELDMNELVSEAVAALGYALRQARATVEVGGLPSCRGDAAMVGQVFSNLLDNAVKYRAPEHTPVIRVTGRRGESEVEYCVEDNGIGIPAELQGKVFGLFHQVDPKHSSGEGLGLAIVTRVLDRLGGSVRLESEPGRGSRFYISLPAA